MIVTVGALEVTVSPVGAQVLARLADGEHVSPMDPHPAARDRLIAKGLIRTSVDGPRRELVLTDLGRRVAAALETATS